MELAVGTKIVYTSAAGTRNAVVESIKIGPTAKPGFLNTWLTLFVPAQNGAKFDTHVQICADNASLKMFKVQVI
jgi:hypothetical protein